MDSFTLSRNWFNFCFENPEKISPNHTALYFFAIEHCNRLGNKEKFGLPTEMAKEAIGIKSWHTYIKAFNNLVDWGFFKLIERSKNQYSSNIIALIKNDKALDKALDKAFTKHASKQIRSMHQSNDSINKQLNKETISGDFDIFWNKYHEITGKPKTDKVPALKHWRKLTQIERQKAIDLIMTYFQSLSDKKYCKKAKTYLADKTFDDEFSSITPRLNGTRVINQAEEALKSIEL